MRHESELIPVSIVIPNYNYERFLRRAIDSALEQAYPNVEVIVVDDASADDSAKVIASYGGRIKTCIKTQNEGHAAAFNSGFVESTGQIVFFLDADDYLYPNAVSDVVNVWNADTAQAQFRLHVVDEEQTIKGIFPPPELPFDAGDVTHNLLRTGRYRTTVTSGLAFDRPVLETILPIPEQDFRQGADGYLVTLAPLFGKVIAIETCLGAYRIHGSNHSVFAHKLAERARWRVQHDFLSFDALSNRAAAVGRKVAPDLGMRDPAHLEERLASLCVDERRHPIQADSRFRLGIAGAAASLRMRASLKRRLFVAIWFLCVGMVPRPMATAILSWKLVATSRPAFLARLSKTIRRAMG
jgi:GT2 family glycosyltransferase